ncbi:MAG: phosphopyruvate hydratase [Theionarchaea archaeon]|nr:phosphopyruvate hydratase [Theionarchaea archaeon]MBU7000204.1 phosphopyruvate hydratase [Theionarchaea archaeon]MBU7020921.1 phosphopyruvate hydratase [Theionarchaea archaeon]MBU7033973.1 phosphopyruvate hydratase [Theionarchaea archaeon]MBU7040531.1 phosphopyruvate hydratase [Theionarchaea archaeon]
MKIRKVIARQIVDSRGNPTVEAEVYTEKEWGRAAVPSGASTGAHEACELRDNNKKYYQGKGVKKAVKNVNEKIAVLLVGKDVENQREIDEFMIELDGTDNKSNLGANAILAVSLAAARCAAHCLQVPLFSYLNPQGTTLPVPMFNVINGGAHAPNDLDFQEFMIAPVGASSFTEALRMGSEVYHELETILGGKQSLGDEGGFSPRMERVREPLDAIMQAVQRLGYEKEVKLALDCAPSYFYDPVRNVYTLDGESMTTDKLIEVYSQLVAAYPIASIEDALFEDDISGFQNVTAVLGDRIMLVGDDLFVSNPHRLKKGIECGLCNALLLKVNQIGTLSEACDAASLAFDNGYRVIVSHRSGETEDTFISHLAVALNCGWIKAGAPARGERTAKYNELLRIEESLGEKATYGSRA